MLEVPWRRGVSFERAIVEKNVVGPAIDHIDFGVGFEERHHAGDGAGIVDIIGVQPANDLAIRGADAFVDGMGLPTVFLRYPAHRRAEMLEYMDSVVRAAAIED